ncbi:hypothetical protein ACH5RR_005096 [Cinchona calisaya]|uniref:Uncharacterized protein n=1 Tax=Cinchona calisaya TaxID=153742 RepID=A0ABD3AK77_9GENT
MLADTMDGSRKGGGCPNCLNSSYQQSMEGPSPTKCLAFGFRCTMQEQGGGWSICLYLDAAGAESGRKLQMATSCPSVLSVCLDNMLVLSENILVPFAFWSDVTL